MKGTGEPVSIRDVSAARRARQLLSRMTAAAEHFSKEDEAILLESIQRWTDKELKPIVKEYDHADRYPIEIV